MKLPLPPAREFRTAEFHCDRPEVSLLVRGLGTGEVLISASNDNFERAQQEAFIQYLCAEGFIISNPASVQLSTDGGETLCCYPVRWTVDRASPSADPIYARHIGRLRFYTVGILLVWLAVMMALVRL